MPPPKHIVVCGAGVIGLCCAYYLRERGHAVTIVERGGPDRDSCSFGNAGTIVPSHVSPLTPQRFMASLERLLREGGATFLWSTAITGWKQSSHGRIAAALTSRGGVAGDEFVLAGGSWSTAMVRTLGLALPLQPGKGYSLTLPQPRRLPRLCSILAEASVAVTPMGSTLRFAGTMELSRLDGSIRPGRVRCIVEAVTRYLPDFRAEDFTGVRPWCGLRPVSPDGLPYVGRFRRYENLSVATGHAMMGMTLGPITGRLIAEILSGEKPSVSLELLDPDRYA